MDKQLRNTFAQLKSKCKTKTQRKAYNRLINSFAERTLRFGDFTDSQDAIEWLNNELGPFDFGYATLTINGKTVGLSFGYDRYSKGDSVDLLYIHAQKLKNHFETLDPEEWRDRIGEMYDYINEVTKKYGD